MKKNFAVKLTALLAAIIVALAPLCACSEINLPKSCSNQTQQPQQTQAPAETHGISPITGKEETKGVYTLIVPESMQLNTVDPDPNTVEVMDKQDSGRYMSFSIINEELAVNTIAQSKELYNGVDAFTDAGGVTWKGTSYKLDGKECFEMYGIIKEKAVMVKCVGYTYMSSEANAVLGSITLADQNA